MKETHPEYHKINSLYKRDPKTNRFIPEFARPEYETLRDVEWRWFEKIDGTNIRIGVKTAPLTPAARFEVSTGGRTDRADIPPSLRVRLRELTDWAPMDEVFDPGSTVTLYGEGYGVKIQKGGGNYIPDGVDFILFDIRIGDVWLEREAVEEIAEKLGIQVVPSAGTMTLRQAEDFVRQGFNSAWINVEPEGIVGYPVGGFRDRLGRRIITKIKGVDFKGLDW